MTDTAQQATVKTARYGFNAAHRVLVGIGVLFLLTVAIIVTVSLLVHLLPTQGPTSAWKYAGQHFGVSNDATRVLAA